MGLVSLGLTTASAAVVYATRRTKDRAVPILAWGLLVSLLASLMIHRVFHSVGRATPLMFLDGLGLYVTGLMAICRFDHPRWLYVLCGALTLQCASHFAFVCFLISGNTHILVLNVLFGAEMLALLAGGGRIDFGWRPALQSWANATGESRLSRVERLRAA